MRRDDTSTTRAIGTPPGSQGAFEPKPVTLDGRVVRLEPMRRDHLDALCAVGLDPELWRWTTMQIASREDMAGYVESAMRLSDQGEAVPFVIVERDSARVVGSTRFANFDRANRHLEIGWSWVAPRWQRSAVNTETKLLLLTHAFETLGCLRVEFKTDSLNERARAALRRLGAVEEGTFRNHMITDSGRIRHSVWFSCTCDEWPAVKARLITRLGAAPLAR